MIKIRKNVFETNSSSAHTFVMTNKNEWVTDDEIQEFMDDVETRIENNIPNGYLPSYGFIEECNFGRGFQMLIEWYEKLAYLYAAYKYEDEYIDLITEVVKERIPGIKGVCFPPAYEYVYDNGKEKTFYDGDWDDREIFGSVDHQSSDMAPGCLIAAVKENGYEDKSKKDIIKEIIFCNNFVIIVDSDEDYQTDELYSDGTFKNLGVTKILSCSYDFKTHNHDYSFVDINEYFKESED